MSYTTLRGRWCDIIVLNEHAPTEDKSGDTKGQIYKELERVFDKFPKYNHMNNFRRFQYKGRERKVFSNQQYAMRVYMKLIMIMVLQQ
jgi:hypothetical protein